MEFHPAANIFPMMTGDEFKTLVESISRNGYDAAFPILTFEGMILDGRNRYSACLELGVTPIYREWGGDDPWEFVWLANSERRHLTQFEGCNKKAPARRTDRMAGGAGTKARASECSAKRSG